MKNIEIVRSVGKRLLQNTPAYEFARRRFIDYKIHKDEEIFRKRHPSASYLAPHDGQVEDLRQEGFFSQYGQDKYLLSRLGTELGFFVDIGCNEPLELSNSYAFEQRGWRGIAIDPMASLKEKWESRRTDFRQVAISDQRETRQYIEIKSHAGWEHALSGFKGFVRREDMDLYGYREYPIECMPLGDLVPEDQQIDVIMIDVEGAELLVLAGIDLDRLSPRCVMIENVAEIGGSEKVRAHMERAGYVLEARIGAADDVFVKGQ